MFLSLISSLCSSVKIGSKTMFMLCIRRWNRSRSAAIDVPIERRFSCASSSSYMTTVRLKWTWRFILHMYNRLLEYVNRRERKWERESITNATIPFDFDSVVCRMSAIYMIIPALVVTISWWLRTCLIRRPKSKSKVYAKQSVVTV